MLADPLLGDRVLIAEPWDIGPGGYQLGNFPPPFLEWNDRYRDGVRRFWRGDRHMLGAFATALAGSSRRVRRRPVDPQRQLHRRARRLHARRPRRLSPQAQPGQRRAQPRRPRREPVLEQRPRRARPTIRRSSRPRRPRPARAARARCSPRRGTIQLTAGDEFGRSQRGNNNAYAQDNAITWLDWDRPRPRARGLVRPAVRAAPRDAGARRPAAADRRAGSRRAARRRLADARRATQGRPSTGSIPRDRRSRWCLRRRRRRAARRAVQPRRGRRCASAAATAGPRLARRDRRRRRGARAQRRLRLRDGGFRRRGGKPLSPRPRRP